MSIFIHEHVKEAGEGKIKHNNVVHVVDSGVRTQLECPHTHSYAHTYISLHRTGCRQLELRYAFPNDLDAGSGVSRSDREKDHQAPPCDCASASRN